MKFLVTTFTCFFFVLSITVNAQTTAQRIETAGKIYVNKVSQERMFLRVKMIDQTPSWGGVKSLESTPGDTVRVGANDIEPAGDLLHLADVDQGLVDAINQQAIDILKGYVASSVTFPDAMDDQGNSFFQLDVVLNPWEVENYIITRISDDGKMTVPLQVELTLSEMTPDDKKPKKVTSVMLKGDLEGIDMAVNSEWSDLKAAIPDIVQKSKDQISQNFSDTKSYDKKFSKAMSK